MGMSVTPQTPWRWARVLGLMTLLMPMAGCTDDPVYVDMHLQVSSERRETVQYWIHAFSDNGTHLKTWNASLRPFDLHEHTSRLVIDDLGSFLVQAQFPLVSEPHQGVVKVPAECTSYGPMTLTATITDDVTVFLECDRRRGPPAS